MPEQEDTQFTMLIPSHEQIRKNFQRDMDIYGNCLVREIRRGGWDSQNVIDADDVHGFLAAVNICLSCIDSQEALDEVRALFDAITGKVAEANQERRNREYEDEEDDDGI